MKFWDFHWSRPISQEYPKVWHRFEVKKINSDEFERFRIQDLPQSRTEEAVEFMVENQLKCEPLSRAYEVYEDKVMIELVRSSWRYIIEQKAVLVCYKEGSNKIVGINMNCVFSKFDFRADNDIELVCNFMKLDNLYKWWRVLLNSLFNFEIFNARRSKQQLFNDIFTSIADDFDGFREFCVSKYLASGGLAVSQQFRRRGIAVHLLKARENFCSEFNIELTMNRFSSDYANKAADRAGFKLARIRSYDDIRKEYPHLPYVESEALTCKFMRIPLRNDDVKICIPDE